MKRLSICNLQCNIFSIRHKNIKSKPNIILVNKQISLLQFRSTLLGVLGRQAPVVVVVVLSNKGKLLKQK